MSILRNPFGCRSGTPELSRRDLLKLSAAGVVGFSMSGWLEALAQDAAKHPQRRRACILLWMYGGPATIDLFDLKPGHPNGGPFREIVTSVPGVRIGEHLPRLARNMHDMAIIRSMSTREGDHERAAFIMRTGYLPQGPIQYPMIGSLLAKELATDESALPNFVSIYPSPINNQDFRGPGFLGARYAPFEIGRGQGVQQAADLAQSLRIPDLRPARGLSPSQVDARVNLLLEVERDLASRNPGIAAQSHAIAYERAARLMRSEAAAAFNLDQEPSQLRDRYGRTLFGQGCLLARRLVERSVPFVKVTLGDWDTHDQNFREVQRLSEVLDPAWSTLMEDLPARGLLESTLIVWMGEFGRTPRITRAVGRDHFPHAWATVLAGGGIRGGQAYGQTSDDGMTVRSAPTDVKTLIATVCRALGIDHTKQNMSNVGRPIRIADVGATPIADIAG